MTQLSDTSPATTGKTSTTGRTLLIAVGLLLLLSFFGVVGVNLLKLGVESPDLAGRAAPDFTLPLFDQFEAEEVTLSELRGQVVLINFWASWCVECYKEAALLEQAWQDYRDDGVMFIGVDYLDTEKAGLAYMEKYNITYPSGPDLGDKISKAYAITGVPETFIIDQNGNIAHVQIGPITKPQLYGLLDQLLDQPPPRS